MSYRGRRTLDLAIALPALMVTTPIVIAAAYLRAKQDHDKHPNGAPIGERFLNSLFFSQKRVGLDGRLFTIYKIKTMRDEEYPNQPQHERIGKVGKFLRKSKIDELPQFLNVVIGNMALVGPRPVMPEDREGKSEYYFRSYDLPGIFSTSTSLGVRNATIDMTPQESEEHVLGLVALDFQDAAQRSVLFDLKIIWKNIANFKKIHAAPDHRNRPGLG